MSTKAFATSMILGVALVAGLAMTAAQAERSTVTAPSAALMTLYGVASARKVEASNISFSSLSAAASTRIEIWASEHGVSLGGSYAFQRRGYTVSFGSRSFDCFAYQVRHGHDIVCVLDDGTLLGAVAVSGPVTQPPQ